MTVSNPAGVCAGCDSAVPTTRKWCSNRCRKQSYGQPCVDCGKRTCFGAESARVPYPRCQECSVEHRRKWTPEVVVARIQEWARLYGDRPAQPDWNPWQARALGQEDRAQRFESANGYWPGFTTLVDVFGSWNAAIEAAGLEPRKYERRVAA